MRDKVINTAKFAISRGFGSYYALPQTTWQDVLNGYQAGKRLDDVNEAKIVGMRTQLEIANNGE